MSVVNERIDGPWSHLADLLDRAAGVCPDRMAVEDGSGGRLRYAELDRDAGRLAAHLQRWGIGLGDRVGLFLPKSLESVTAIHGILRSGAAYVPVDPDAPAIRGAGVFADGEVRAVVVDRPRVESLREAWPSGSPLPRLIIVDRVAGVDGPRSSDSDGANLEGDPREANWHAILANRTATFIPTARRPDDLAYILYTSGSTGRPKGVMLTHANAACFLGWCRSTFSLGPDDRFSSHAPFHFDLSIFDLFVSCAEGATLVLIDEALGKDPQRLSEYLASKKLTVWYSAPSILTLMTQYGGIDQADYPAPRLVLFAGEVFPITHLRRLRTSWPNAELWNLYGPTETNVCNAYRIPEAIDADRSEPFPIGPVCPPLRARVVDAEGSDVPVGTVGELVISGPGVMSGYFRRPDLTEPAFLRDEEGCSWYRTGDLVVDLGQGVYQYRGRRDRMVKKRGYRIELGEIESALHRSDSVERAAVIAHEQAEGLSIRAYLTLKTGRKRSLIAMKRHCTTYLPHYMVPDRISFLDAMPETSTAKVDYQGLKRLAASED